MFNFHKIKPIQLFRRIGYPGGNKLLQIIKMTVIFSILGLTLQGLLINFLLASDIIGQDLKDIKVTLSVHNVSFEDALEKIEEQTNFTFIYIKEQVPFNEKVTFNINEESLYDLLIRLSSRFGLKFQRINNLIVIKNPKYYLTDLPIIDETGSVKGKVTDAATGDPLVGANILVTGTNIGTATNMQGEFDLKQIPAGEQTLKISYLSYRSQSIELNIISGRTIEYNIALVSEVLDIDEIIVSSQALGQVEAIRRQVNSNTIVNVVSGTRLRELPDANAAEATGRLPGVSIIRDAGEANKVAIRGLSPQYNLVTIDGDRVTGTDLGGREVDMSMISPEMLSGIEVYKVLRPDMDADAIGGSVNFSFSGAPVENQYRIRFSSGYHNQVSDIGTYKASVSGSRRFFDNLVGVRGSFNAERVDRSSHVFGATYGVLRSALPGEPHAPIETNSVRLTDREETRERYGAALNIDLQIPNNQFNVNLVYGRLNRNELSILRNYNVEENTQNWVFGDRDIRIDILTSSLGGKHSVFGGLFNVDWRLSRNISTQDDPYDNSVTFIEGNALNRNLYVVGMSPNQIPGVQYDNLDNTSLRSLDHAIHEAQERDLAASLNIEVPFGFGSFVTGQVKFGGKHYIKDKYRESRGFGVRQWMFVSRYQSYGIITDPAFPLVRADDGRPSIIPFIEDSPYSILDDQYNMRLRFNRDLMNSMWENNGDLYLHNPATRLSNYDVTERVSAGYIMAEVNLGERLMIMPGIRYEFEKSEYDAVRKDFTLEWPDDGNWERHEDLLEDVTATHEEEMWFPMIQARYKVTDWFDVRMARTQSTSRPDFYKRSPRRIVNESDRTVIRGQPDLKLPKAVNYDLFFTAYSNQIGLLTLGGFYKEIDNLIYNRQTVVLNSEEMDLPEGTRGFTLTEPINNPNVTLVRGLEIEWQSNLIWLPSPFNGLVINANLTLIDSKSHYPGFRSERTPQGTVVIDTFRVAPMVDQPDYVSNISVGYDYKDFSARVSMLYQGSTLYSLSSTRSELDRFVSDYLRWDISLKQNIFDNLASVYVNVQNVTNRRDYSIQFTDLYPRAMEYYGWILEGGVNINL